MKKIIIISIISLITISNSTLFGQSVSNPSPLDIMENSLFQRTTNKFIRGWNWGNVHKNIDEAMYMNALHHSCDNYLQTHLFMDSLLRIEYYAPLGSWNEGILQGLSMQYDVEIDFYQNTEPALYHTFQKKPGDETGAVFGFRHIDNGRVNTNGLVYANIIKKPLYTISAFPINILSNPYPDDKLNATYYKQYEPGVFECIDTLKNGMQWYISLKIRLDEDIIIDPNGVDEPVLTIRLPYKYKTIIGYTEDEVPKPIIEVATRNVYFDSIPAHEPGISINGSKNPIIATSEPIYRGVAQFLEEHNNGYPDEFIITKKMLRNYIPPSPEYPNTNEFTFSAFFRMDNCMHIITKNIDTTINEIDTTIQRTIFEVDSSNTERLAAYDDGNGIYNLLLKTNDWKDTTDVVTNMGIEVYYHNNYNISIDWIRFETPHARKIFRGELDEAIGEAVQGMLTIVDDENTAAGLHNRIFKIYGVDIEFLD